MLLKLQLRALEPISIGLESIGTKMLLYRMTVMTPEGEVLETPVIPGNSLRGVLRDEMTLQFLSDTSSAYKRKKLSVHAGTALSLFSGGILSRGEEEGVDATTLDRIIQNYVRYLLPMSILGASIAKIMIPSKLKVGIGYPITYETHFLTNDLINVAPNHHLKDIVISVLMTRKDDRAKFAQLDDLDIQLPDLDQFLRQVVRGKGRETAVQQRFEREAVAPGTTFVTYIGEILPLTEYEKGLLLKTLKQVSSVGGRVAGGLGEFKLTIDGMTDTDQKNFIAAYEAFIKKKRRSILNALAMNPQEL